MSFRRGGASKRRDAIEPAVVDALRACGVRVWQVHGAGLPDLLCLRGGRFYALEVKSAGGRLTPAQAGQPWPVARSVNDAFAVLGIEEASAG